MRKNRRGFTQHHFSTKSGAGFTLMELMVVVTIMAILITSALVFGNNFLTSTAVKTATRDVASTMRMAHSKAGALKTNYVVVFDNQEPPDTQARVWVQPRDGFDPDDTSTWDPVFGTERRLSKRVQIASVTHTSWYTTGTDYYRDVDDPCQVGYMTFYWDGTAVPMTVEVWDTKGNNQYSLTVVYTSSRVKIRKPD